MSEILLGDELTRQVDEGPSASDRIFFRLHPRRSFRLRRAWLCEVEAFVRKAGMNPELPDDWCWWIVVHQLAPGARMGIPVGAPHQLPVETSEADARRVFQRAAAPKWKKLAREIKRDAKGGNA
jgi:hypothetical protein